MGPSPSGRFICQPKMELDTTIFGHVNHSNFYLSATSHSHPRGFSVLAQEPFFLDVTQSPSTLIHKRWLTPRISRLLC